MALHRDILWIGRQWAVTGHGMQLIDQRLEGAFDVELIRLWDDDLIESLRSKAWIKAEDFDKGLAVARTRYPKSEAGSTSIVELPAPAIEPIALAPPPKPAQPTAVEPPQSPVPSAAVDPQPLSIEPPPQELPDLQMKIDGRARFARPWRVWVKKHE